MWTKKFWLRTFERALRAGANTLVGLIGTNGLGLLDFNWESGLSVAGMAAVTSVLFSVGGSFIGDEESPALFE